MRADRPIDMAPKVMDVASAAGAFKLARAIQAAALWGLFEALSELGSSIDELTLQLQRPRRMLEALCATLVPAGVLVHENGLLEIAEPHKMTLAPGGPGSMLSYIKWMGFQYSQFDLLIDATDRCPDWSGWMDCLDELACRNGYASAMTACLPFDSMDSVLDLGGGSGIYARYLCERFPRLRVTVFDRPPVAEIAQRRIESWGLATRVHVLAGDFNEDVLPAGHGAVFASNVIHGKSEAQVIHLMDKVLHALKPGGIFVIHGNHIEGAFGHSLEAGLLHLTMVMNGGGTSHTVNRLQSLGEQSGFETLATASPRQQSTPDLLILRSAARS